MLAQPDTWHAGVSTCQVSNAIKSIVRALNIIPPMLSPIYRLPVQTSNQPDTTCRHCAWHWCYQIIHGSPWKTSAVVSTINENNDSLSEGAAPSVANFQQHQASNLYCRHDAQSVSTTNAECTIDERWTDSSSSSHRWNCSNSCTKSAPEALPVLLTPPCSGKPSCSKPSKNLYVKGVFWSPMTNKVYKTVNYYSTCAWNGSSQNFKRKVQFFLTNGTLEFVTIDIPVLLLRTVSGNQYKIVMICGLLKFILATLTGRTSSSHIASVFLGSWVVPYCKPTKVLAVIGAQFRRRLFAMVRSILGVKHQEKTAYHTLTNAPVEWDNILVVTQLQNYVIDNQKNWDTFVQPLPFANSAQTPNYTNTTFISFVLSQHPPGSTTVSQPSVIASDSYDYTDPRWLRLSLQ